MLKTFVSIWLLLIVLVVNFVDRYFALLWYNLLGLDLYRYGVGAYNQKLQALVSTLVMSLWLLL